jgi:hypothetical protein
MIGKGEGHSNTAVDTMWHLLVTMYRVPNNRCLLIDVFDDL